MISEPLKGEVASPPPPHSSALGSHASCRRGGQSRGTVDQGPADRRAALVERERRTLVVSRSDARWH